MFRWTVTGRRWVACAALSAAAACGQDTRTIQGVREVRYVTENGVTAVPLDLSGYVIAALVPDGDGGYDEYPGHGRADGTFVIEGVPKGTYFLSWLTDELSGTVASPVVISERDTSTPDLSFYQMGRPDQDDPDEGTVLRVAFDGLSPWQAEDSLTVFSPSSGLYSYLSSRGLEPEVGATSVEEDLALYDPGSDEPRIEGTKGDRAYFAQLASTEAAQGTYQSLQRLFVPEPFDIADGQVSDLAGSFESIPQDREIEFVLPEENFEGTVQAIHPLARSYSGVFVVGALSRWAELGEYGGWPDLLVYGIEPGTGDVADTLSYGDPFPSEWDRLVLVWWLAEVEYKLSDVMFRATLYGGTGRQLALNGVPEDGSIVPLVSHVRSPTINGEDAFSEVRAAGETPRIEWTAPERGEDVRYQVEVFEVFQRGETTAFTVVDDVAWFDTTDTSFTLPPGILHPGRTYALRIAAFAGPRDDRSWSSVLTSMFTA
jgi:hypothetical protein